MSSKPIIGLDPGTERSAAVVLEGDEILSHIIGENEAILDWLVDRIYPAILVIEEFESYGMAVGREVFRTVRWSGRFEQAWRWPSLVTFMPRRDVKQHLCHSARATDSNIRQALLDRFGGSKAMGTKKAPGPLFGIRSHLWAALALALTYQDKFGANHEDK